LDGIGGENRGAYETISYVALLSHTGGPGVVVALFSSPD
jgi:hypothetical protein